MRRGRGGLSTSGALRGRLVARSRELDAELGALLRVADRQAAPHSLLDYHLGQVQCEADSGILELGREVGIKDLIDDLLRNPSVLSVMVMTSLPSWQLQWTSTAGSRVFLSTRTSLALLSRCRITWENSVATPATGNISSLLRCMVIPIS
jgi:hypothetical protein